MNENTKETYAASTQRVSFVGSLVVDRSVLDPMLTRCTGRAGIRTESPGTPKPKDWFPGTEAAKLQPSSLFH